MTLKEKIICSAYTGINFCGDEEEFDKFMDYVDEVMGYSPQTIEMASESFWKRLQELTKSDFHRVLIGEFKDE